MGLSSTSPTNLQKPIWWVCDQQKGLIKQSEMVILYHSTTKQHGFKCANDGISTGSNFKQWKAASPFLPMVVVWEGKASSALLVQTDCTQPAANLLLSIFSNHISHWGRNTWKKQCLKFKQPVMSKTVYIPDLQQVCALDSSEVIPIFPIYSGPIFLCQSRIPTIDTLVIDYFPQKHLWVQKGFPTQKAYSSYLRIIPWISNIKNHHFKQISPFLQWISSHAAPATWISRSPFWRSLP